jgi:hypothetical protein
MNTKIVMSSSAILLGLAGLSFSFIPNELAAFARLGIDHSSILSLQVIGALLFGFGVLNWMAKGSLIGGIYAKPIVTANLSHFLIVSLALIKVLLSGAINSLPFYLLTAVYVLFAVLFGWLFFNSPVGNKNA